REGGRRVHEAARGERARDEGRRCRALQHGSNDQSGQEGGETAVGPPEGLPQTRSEPARDTGTHHAQAPEEERDVCKELDDDRASRLLALLQRETVSPHRSMSEA